MQKKYGMLFYLKREKYENKARQCILVNPNGIRLLKSWKLDSWRHVLQSSFHYNKFSSVWAANGQLIILHAMEGLTRLHPGTATVLMHINLLIKERWCFVFSGLLGMSSSWLRAGWVRAQILGLPRVAQCLVQGCVLVFPVPLWPVRDCHHSANACSNLRYFPNVPRHIATKQFMA